MTTDTNLMYDDALGIEYSRILVEGCFVCPLSPSFFAVIQFPIFFGEIFADKPVMVRYYLHHLALYLRDRAKYGGG